MFSVVETDHKKTRFELGQPSHCPSGGLAMPRSIFYVFGCVLFWHDVDHAPKPTKWRPAGLFVFVFVFLSERCDRNKYPTKYERTHNLSVKKKWKEKLAFSLFAHAVQGRGWKLSDRKSLTWSAIFPTFGRYHLTFYIESSFGGISWWVANWAMKLISMFSLCLEHFLHHTSPWSGRAIFRRI